MTLLLHAQPYDIAADGFYFRDVAEYQKQAATLKNRHCDPVEEFEIQFIDGERIDGDLANAWDLNQSNLSKFFDVVEKWDDEEKACFIIAVGECGYSFDPATQSPSVFDVDIYQLDSLRDLAIQFVEEGLFGDVSEKLEFYIDYDAIARDLSFDYAQTEIAGERLIYRCW